MLSYYKQAKENGWKAPIYTLKCKVNKTINFEMKLKYTDLILKLVEYSAWTIPLEITVYENDINKTAEIMERVFEYKRYYA